jgi:hypothetical protein
MLPRWYWLSTHLLGVTQSHTHSESGVGGGTKRGTCNDGVLGPLASYGDADLIPTPAVENAARLLYCELYGRKDFVGNLEVPPL